MPAMPRKILLENAYIVANNGTRDFLWGDLIISDDRIEKIIPKQVQPLSAGPAEIPASGTSPGEFSEIHDLQGKILIPGFVQPHVHLCQVMFRNLADDLELLDWLSKKIWPMEARHTRASLYSSARLGIAELLAGGTTTILDMGTTRHTDAIFEAARDLGIRATIGKCMMDLAEASPELLETREDSFAQSTRLAKTWHGMENNRLRYAFSPRFVLSCSPELLRDSAAFARDHGMLLHTHASENRAELDWIRNRFGCDNVEYLHQLGLTGPNLVLAHCIWLSEAETEIIRATATKVVHCPSANLKLASGFAKIPELREKGIAVGLGADGAPCNNNLNIFQEMRLASLIQKPRLGPRAMGAAEVFEMATLGGARVLGLEAEIGSLEPGKKADLVVLDLDQVHSSIARPQKTLAEVLSAIVYSAGPQNVAQTWVDGRLCYQAGQVDYTDLRDFVLDMQAHSAVIAGL